MPTHLQYFLEMLKPFFLALSVSFYSAIPSSVSAAPPFTSACEDGSNPIHNVYHECSRYRLFMQTIGRSPVFLAFVEPSARSPMSYFGHVFLVFGSPNNPFSRVLSFSAMIPSGSSYFGVLTKGGMGALDGRFVFSPLHLINDLYASGELRNITFYPLELTQSESESLKLNVYDRYFEKQNYDFFNKNCATKLLELFSSFASESGVAFEVNGIRTPSGVVHRLRQHGFIATEGERVRSDLERLFLLKQQDSGGLDLENYIRDLEAKVSFKHFGIAVDDYKERRKKLFDENDFEISSSLSSASDLPSNKLGLGFIYHESGSALSLSYSPYYLRSTDAQFSFFNETTATIADVEFAVGENSSSLKKVDLLYLESLNKKAGSIWLPSWSLYLGKDERLGSLSKSESFFRVSVGKSIGTEKLIITLMPQYEWGLEDGVHGLNLAGSVGLWQGRSRYSVNLIKSLLTSRSDMKDGLSVEYSFRVRNQFFVSAKGRDHGNVELGVSYRFR